MGERAKKAGTYVAPAAPNEWAKKGLAGAMMNVAAVFAMLLGVTFSLRAAGISGAAGEGALGWALFCIGLVLVAGGTYWSIKSKNKMNRYRGMMFFGLVCAAGIGTALLWYVLAYVSMLVS